MWRKRLNKEFAKFQKSKPEDMTLALTDRQNVLVATVRGPKETFWYEKAYRMQLRFTQQYPHKAPIIQITSKIFHPNVYQDGRICLDILSNEWSPIYDIQSILTSIRSLLNDPNPDSPANGLAAEMYRVNKDKYKEINLADEASFAKKIVEAREPEEEDEDINMGIFD